MARTLRQCNKLLHFLKIARSHPDCEVERCRKGWKIRKIKNDGTVEGTWTMHHQHGAKELSTGMRQATIKWFISMGIGTIILYLMIIC